MIGVGKCAPGADWMREKVPEGCCYQVIELTEAVRLEMDKWDEWAPVVGDVVG